MASNRPEKLICLLRNKSWRDDPFARGAAVGTQREFSRHPKGADVGLITAKPFTLVNYEFNHSLPAVHTHILPPSIFFYYQESHMAHALIQFNQACYMTDDPSHEAIQISPNPPFSYKILINSGYNLLDSKN